MESQKSLLTLSDLFHNILHLLSLTRDRIVRTEISNPIYCILELTDNLGWISMLEIDIEDVVTEFLSGRTGFDP